MNNYPDFLIYIYFDYKKYDVKIHHRIYTKARLLKLFVQNFFY